MPLPAFILERDLTDAFAEKGLNSSSLWSYVPKHLKLDWSNVRFFDDASLLTLVLTEFGLTQRGWRIAHEGLTSLGTANVIAQLHAIGFSELLLSNIFSLSKDRLADIDQVLAANPFMGASSVANRSRVMRIVSCHSDDHFNATSKENQRIEAFEGAYSRATFVNAVEGDIHSWEIVETGDFRSLILDQTRLNVREHARPVNLGLSVARVFMASDLKDVWDLSEKEIRSLRSREGQIPRVLRSLGEDVAVLQIVTIDDGIGIPRRLRPSLPQRQKTLFPETEERKSDLDRFLADTKSWPEDAVVCSFAAMAEGTSKKTEWRSPHESKGLTVIRSRTQVPGGSLEISSNGVAVSYGDPTAYPWGSHHDCGLRWCPDGGTRISALVPTRRSTVPSATTRPSTARYRVNPVPLHRQDVEVISVREAWNRCFATETPLADVASACSSDLCKHVPPSAGTDPERPILFDWGEMPFDKDVASALLVKMAEELAKTIGRARPYLFANLSRTLCTLARSALQSFRRHRLPVCVLAQGRECFWLGLPTDEAPEITSMSKDQAFFAKNVIRQKRICGARESSTEAFYHYCIDRIWTQAMDYALPPPRYLSVSTDLSQAIGELLEHCSLLRRQKATDGPTGDEMGILLFTARATIDGFAEKLRSGFLARLQKIVEGPDVKQTKPGRIRSTTGQVVDAYYRCDFLVDSDVAEELASELTDVALSLNERAGPIDMVVGCTLPTSWFVERIADGLRDHGVTCSSHVFQQRSTIGPETKVLADLSRRKVLLFSDVLGTGSLVETMAGALTEAGALLVGLVVLVDSRTSEAAKAQLKEKDPLRHFQRGSVVPLLSIPLAKEPAGTPSKWYIDPYTLAPREHRNDDRRRSLENYSEDRYLGRGPKFRQNYLLGNAAALVSQIDALGGIRVGHFVHGNHHSEVLCDVRRLFRSETFRDFLVNQVLAYIVANDIQFVVSPNHSNIYVLRDELKRRYAAVASAASGVRDNPVFATACLVRMNGAQSDYILGTDRHLGEGGRKPFERILILDDGICSGGTIRSLVKEAVIFARESVRLHSVASPNIRIHVVTVVSNLQESDVAFWEALEELTGSRLSLAYLMSLPATTFAEAHCPACRYRRSLQRAHEATMLTAYERDFVSLWTADLMPTGLHEQAPSGRKAELSVSGRSAREVAACIMALNDGHTKVAQGYAHTAGQNVVAIYLLGRLLQGTVDQQMQGITLEEVLVELCHVGWRSADDSNCRTEFLRQLCRIAENARPSKALNTAIAEATENMISHLDDVTTLGGLAYLFRLYCGRTQRLTGETRGSLLDLVDNLYLKLDDAARQLPPSPLRTYTTWLRAQLASAVSGQGGIDSVGAAVLAIVEHNSVLSEHHRTSANAIIELQKTLTTIANARAGVSRQAIDRANSFVVLVRECFDQMFACLRVLGQRSPKSLDALEGILAHEHGKGNLVPINDSSAGPGGVEGWAEKSMVTLSTMREAFKGPSPARIVRIIEEYVTRPYSLLRQRIEKDARRDVALRVEDSDASFNALEVICDPQHLDDAIRHIHANVGEKRLRGNASAVWKFDKEKSSRRRARLVCECSNTKSVPDDPE